MKTSLCPFILAALMASAPAGAQVPAAINFQGRLLSGTNLANGNVGVSLRVFDSPAGGTLLYEDSNTVAVVDGLYATIIGDNTTTGSLATALASTNAHIEIMVDGVALAPRERIAAVAYSILTEAVKPGGVTATMLADGAALAEILDDDGSGSTLDADSLDGLDASAFAGAFHAHSAADITAGILDDARLGTNVSLLGPSVDSSEIADGSITAADISPATFSNTFWGVSGNAGTSTGAHFLGTTDNAPLEFRVNGQRALLVIPASSPNLIGGSPSNAISTGTVAAVISGGRSNAVGVSADAASIAGGSGNAIAINADGGAIGGGTDNRIESGANGSVIAGGGDNTVGPLSFFSVIAGGNGHDVATNCWYAVIGGGLNNSVDSNALYATVLGGNNNEAAGSYALAAGRNARAIHEGAFVWADSSAATFSSSASNQFLVRAGGGVGINTNNPQQALHINGNAQASRFYFSSNAWLQLDATGTNLQFVAGGVTNQLN